MGARVGALFWLSEIISFFREKKDKGNRRFKKKHTPKNREMRVFPRAEEGTPVFKLKWSQNRTKETRPILPIIFIFNMKF